MIGRFKTIKKLLCFLIISIFIIGFGGEVVKAETFTSLGTLKYRKWGTGTSLDNYTYFQHIQLNGQDAYCLNSTKNFPTVNLTLMDGLVPKSKKQAIINTINAGTASNLGVSHGEAYYLTQAAVWYHMGGVVSNNRTQDGLGQGFYNWILANYPTQWSKLMDAADDSISYNFSISGTREELVDSDDYMFSGDFKINSNIPGNYIVEIDSDSSEGACILYNSSCSATVEVPADTVFKVRINKPTDASGNVEATFSAKPKTNPSVYTLKTYGGASSQGFQNVALVSSEPKSYSDKQTVNGNYKNEAFVEIQKVDYETNKKVAGALISVYKANGARIGSYVSTGVGEVNPAVPLTVGDYYLQEDVAPQGYYLNTEKVEFSVVDDNGTVRVKQGNDFVDSATITVKNKIRKIKFKKVDQEGNPVEGIKLIITSYAWYSTHQPNSVLCAYTDSNGLLTIPCEGYESIVQSDGIYTLGIDFGGSTDIYQVTEECDNDKCKKYDTSSFNSGNSFYFGFNDNDEIVSLRDDVIIDTSDNSEIPTISISFVNKNFLDISKTDVTTGAEIEGAHLKVYDPSITDGDNIVDEWVSEKDKTHHISMLTIGKRYALEETIAPEGYVAVSTTIHFEMDEDGNVKVYDPETGDEIKDISGSDYKLLIPNDYTKVQISKTDMVTGEEVEGAEIKLCTAEEYETNGLDCTPSKDEWSWVSGTEPKYIEKLATGDYYLIETIAPEGYIRQTNAVKFTVNEEIGIQQVEFKNEPTKVTVEKKDYKTGAAISGVTFQIINAETNEVVREWVSDDLETGHMETAIPVGKYKLIETVYPEGYKEGMIIDGIVTSEYEFEITEEVSDVTITVYNEALVDVPSTGISTINLVAIGGLMIFIGYQVIKLYRKRVIN